MNPKLTLNLGVRWDLFTPYQETRGFQSNFVPAGGNGLTANFYIPNGTCSTPRATIFNTVAALSNINISCSGNAALGNAQKTNFAPRVGFAYKLRPTGGTRRLRHGLWSAGQPWLRRHARLGLNYPFGYTQTVPSPDSNHPLLAGASNTPATLENTLITTTSPVRPRCKARPRTQRRRSLAPLCPSALRGSRQYIGSDYLGATLNGRQPNYQTPMIQTENFTVEDQFTSHEPSRRDMSAPRAITWIFWEPRTATPSSCLPAKTPVVYSVPVHGAQWHLPKPRTPTPATTPCRSPISTR